MTSLILTVTAILSGLVLGEVVAGLIVKEQKR